ncbi:MAG: hypothetical protein WAZ48_09200 [Lysobacteraceae bacterium]
MNTQTQTTESNVRSHDNVVAFAAKARHSYRTPSFGIGYGTSSGYGTDKRYTTDWGQIRFRCA